MNRGDGRKPTFKDHAGWERFLATVGQAWVKTGWVHSVLHWKGQMSDAQTCAALPQKVEAQKP
jgi:hypothetical protein